MKLKNISYGLLGAFVCASIDVENAFCAKSPEFNQITTYKRRKTASTAEERKQVLEKSCRQQTLFWCHDTVRKAAPAFFGVGVGETIDIKDVEYFNKIWSLLNTATTKAMHIQFFNDALWNFSTEQYDEACRSLITFLFSSSMKGAGRSVLGEGLIPYVLDSSERNGRLESDIEKINECLNEASSIVLKKATTEWNQLTKERKRFRPCEKKPYAWNFLDEAIKQFVEQGFVNGDKEKIKRDSVRHLLGTVKRGDFRWLHHDNRWINLATGTLVESEQRPELNEDLRNFIIQKDGVIDYLEMIGGLSLSGEGIAFDNDNFFTLVEAQSLKNKEIEVYRFAPYSIDHDKTLRWGSVLCFFPAEETFTYVRKIIFPQTILPCMILGNGQHKDLDVEFYYPSEIDFLGKLIYKEDIQETRATVVIPKGLDMPDKQKIEEYAVKYLNDLSICRGGCSTEVSVKTEKDQNVLYKWQVRFDSNGDDAYTAKITFLPLQDDLTGDLYWKFFNKLTRHPRPCLEVKIVDGANDNVVTTLYPDDEY